MASLLADVSSFRSQLSRWGFLLARLTSLCLCSRDLMLSSLLLGWNQRDLRYGVSLLHDRQRELQGATKLAEGRNQGRSGTTGNHKALGKWKQQGPHVRAAGASCQPTPLQRGDAQELSGMSCALP